MFVLRELRAAVHFCALTLSVPRPGRTCSTRAPSTPRSWAGSRRIPGAEAKRRATTRSRDQTNRRMGEIIGAALTSDEADELARLSTAALAAMSQAGTGR